MVFKLVRTDSVDSCKIQLPVGTHLIGRGKFLNCDDKRVSRNHGELEVTEDALTIKALHLNPCFYIKNSTDEKNLLKLNCTTNLTHGDKFGLLPESFWFEVLHCTVPVVDKNSSPECVNDNRIDHDSALTNTEDLADTAPFEDNLNNSKNSDNEDCSLPLNFDLNETVENVNEQTDNQSSPSLLPTSNQTTHNNTVEEVATPSPDPCNEVKTPIKRSHSSGETSPDVDVKKVKLEPDDPVDVKPGTSNDQVGSDSGSKDNNVPLSPMKPTNNLPSRERCIYGANCYRRNPQHKAQFSHPQDSDWGAGERGVCPYGASCRRREPRHWQSHTHPPGVQPPAPHAPFAPGPGMQVVRRNGNIFYINAHSVNFYDDHFHVEDSDGDSVDYDYEF